MTAFTVLCLAVGLCLNLALIAADGGRWGMDWQFLENRL